MTVFGILTNVLNASNRKDLIPTYALQKKKPILKFLYKKREKKWTDRTIWKVFYFIHYVLRTLRPLNFPPKLFRENNISSLQKWEICFDWWWIDPPLHASNIIHNLLSKYMNPTMMPFIKKKKKLFAYFFRRNFSFFLGYFYRDIDVTSDSENPDGNPMADRRGVKRQVRGRRQNLRSAAWLRCDQLRLGSTRA